MRVVTAPPAPPLCETSTLGYRPRRAVTAGKPGQSRGAPWRPAAPEGAPWGARGSLELLSCGGFVRVPGCSCRGRGLTSQGVGSLGVLRTPPSSVKGDRPPRASWFQVERPRGPGPHGLPHLCADLASQTRPFICLGSC